MKKFIVNLLSNRFGIILATLNVCYFMSKGNNFTDKPFGKIFLCANFPAALPATLSVEFINIFVHNLSDPAKMILANAFFIPFCIIQWLFIAWFARTIAQKIRPTEL
jgi:hypothetical protein